MRKPQKSSRSPRTRNQGASSPGRRFKGRGEEPRPAGSPERQFDPAVPPASLAKRTEAPTPELVPQTAAPALQQAQGNVAGGDDLAVKPRLQHIVSFTDLVIAVVGGSRLDIVSLLTDGALFSGVIGQRLGIKPPEASKELHELLHNELVACERIGYHSLYRLTDRLRIFRRNNMLQISIGPAAGHWAHIHLDESFGQFPAVPPPDHFLG